MDKIFAGQEIGLFLVDGSFLRVRFVQRLGEGILVEPSAVSKAVVHVDYPRFVCRLYPWHRVAMVGLTPEGVLKAEISRGEEAEEPVFV